MLVLLLLFNLRLINRSGLRISHSKVFSSGCFKSGSYFYKETTLKNKIFLDWNTKDISIILHVKIKVKFNLNIINRLLLSSAQ